MTRADRILVGGYGPERGGTSPGILRSDLRALTQSETLARCPSPSWLAPHPTLPVLYAALEDDGELATYTWRDGGLESLGHPIRIGSQLCHLAIDPSGQHLVASCYGDGTVVLVEIGVDGSPRVLDTATAVGVRPSRAHCAVFVNGLLVTTDLGHDCLRIWSTAEGRLAALGSVSLPDGSGPRHVAVTEDGAVLVVTEYSNELVRVAAGLDQSWRVTDSCELAPGIDLTGSCAAEITYDSSTQLAYAGIRGIDAIATIAIEASGLRPIALSPTGGIWPRHHVLSGGELIVANQLSNELTVLPLDAATGVPGPCAARVPIPSPACVAPLG